MTGEAKKWLRFRIFTLLIFFLVLFIALISRAFQIQVLSGKDLKSLAEKQHIKTLLIEPERGIIFDRNGEKLAVSVMVDSLCADPSKIGNPREVAEKIASVLHIDKEAIVKKLSGSRNFCWIARKLTPNEAKKIESLNIEHIYMVKEPKRFYPNGELAGRLIGFVGLDCSGLEGLELRYDKYLRGVPQKIVWARDARGKKLTPRIEKVSEVQEGGFHLILTIDSRIQHIVESSLSEAIKDKGAKGGFAIVMDTKTGEILAMADKPGFDPNTFSSYGNGRGTNRIIGECFDPGSTFKPFLVAGALEEGVVKETTRLNCENGMYAVADRVIHEANRKKYGVLSVYEILKYSSNIGCIKISERLGKDKFYHYITQFGFGSKTGIDLPGESGGILRPSSKWTRVDQSTIAFGQGVSVTAIQLITALSAIANQGILMRPYIVRAVIDKNGRVIEKFSPIPVRRVISAETAKRLSSIMKGVVNDSDGTGKRAQIEHVSVAGKTGTSQKIDFARKVYSSERVRTSFMGFFPAEDPQIAILVTLDEPQKDKWGGVAAAPVFKKIGEQIIRCFKTDLHKNPFTIPDGIAPYSTPKLTLVSTPVAITPKDADTDLGDESRMPDFRGLTIREALKRASERDIQIKVVGTGWAVDQDPKPGTIVKDSRFCTVTFSLGY